MTTKKRRIDGYGKDKAIASLQTARQKVRIQCADIVWRKLENSYAGLERVRHTSSSSCCYCSFVLARESHTKLKSITHTTMAISSHWRDNILFSMKQSNQRGLRWTTQIAFSLGFQRGACSKNKITEILSIILETGGWKWREKF